MPNGNEEEASRRMRDFEQRLRAAESFADGHGPECAERWRNQHEHNKKQTRNISSLFDKVSALPDESDMTTIEEKVDVTNTNQMQLLTIVAETKGSLRVLKWLASAVMSIGLAYITWQITKN